MLELTSSARLAERLRVSVDAVELARALELVDLDVRVLLPVHLLGYDVRARHVRGPLFGLGFGHFDVPRAADGGLSGAMWSTGANPFRTARGRWNMLLRSLERLREIIATSSGTLQLARTLGEYRAARARGAMACLPAVLGASGLGDSLGGPRDVPDRLVTRVTLVHALSSGVGATAGPWGRFRRYKGLRARGRALVEQLDEERVFVDLAGAHPQTFWDAVDAHDRCLPLLSTHAGVAGVNPVAGNLDDAQLRGIADTGGVVGITFSRFGLGRWERKHSGRAVIAHLEHAIRVAGEAHVGLGSSYDGWMGPPKDLRSAESYPCLVQYMLDAGWPAGRIERVLGANFLRAFGEIRPEGAGSSEGL